jgi:hypothetical protein
LGKGPDQYELGARRSVEAVGRWQAGDPALLIEVVAAGLQASLHQPVDRPPGRPSESGFGSHRTDRKGRDARSALGKDVRHEGCPSGSVALGRQGRGDRQDVVDHDFWSEVLQQRHQCECRLAAARLSRTGRRKDPVGVGGCETDSLCLDHLSPLGPGLEHYLVTPTMHRPGKGQGREYVTRVAECGNQAAQRSRALVQPVGGTTFRRCPARYRAGSGRSRARRSWGRSRAGRRRLRRGPLGGSSSPVVSHP